MGQLQRVYQLRDNTKILSGFGRGRKRLLAVSFLNKVMAVIRNDAGHERETGHG
jgi:hypothetical protein